MEWMILATKINFYHWNLSVKQSTREKKQQQHISKNVLSKNVVEMKFFVQNIRSHFFFPSRSQIIFPKYWDRLCECNRKRKKLWNKIWAHQIFHSVSICLSITLFSPRILHITMISFFNSRFSFRIYLFFALILFSLFYVYAVA